MLLVRLMLEDLAYFTKSTSSCSLVSVSFIQLPAINFYETELPGNRFAVSDKLACFCSPIDSHNEKCAVNPAFFSSLCARKLRSENSCSVICFRHFSMTEFSLSLCLCWFDFFSILYQWIIAVFDEMQHQVVIGKNQSTHQLSNLMLRV